MLENLLHLKYQLIRDQHDGWTASFRPWELLHFERFETRAQAMRREKQLKSFQGRVFVRSLIENKSHR